MSYNGHKNWTQWNVALWINNDEGLYNMARFYVHHWKCRGKDYAAKYILERLADEGVTETPDGAKYSKTAIRAAMVGM